MGFQLALVAGLHGIAAPAELFLLLALGLNTAGVILGFFEHFSRPAYFFWWSGNGSCGDSLLRARSEAGEDRQCSRKFSRIHPNRLRVAADRRRSQYLGSRAGEAPGIWGASRHALTVGFIAAMIFSVGQRILPSFCGMRVLWSPRLMLVMLVLLMSGCTLRVASEILAYQDYAAWAWNVLPISALIELTAVTLFAVNLIVTFARPPVVVASPLTMTTE